MHPYRTAPEQGDDDDELAPPLEDWLIAWALVGLGGLRVAIACVADEVFGVEATSALLLFALGLAFVGSLARKRRASKR